MKQEQDSALRTAESDGKKNLGKRTLTGFVYGAIIFILIALKWCVPNDWGALGFDALFCAVSVLGSIEFLRAMDNGKTGSERISTPQRVITIAFCSLVVPLYVLVEMVMGQGFLAVACAFCVYLMFAAALSVFDHVRSTVRNSMICVFCMLYCGIACSVLSGVNHLEQNSMVAILILFGCTIFTDIGAYVAGSTLKRFFPAKLAPQLSPNKTVIGAIGGIVFSVLAAVIIYFIIYFLGGINGETVFTSYNGVYLTFTSEAIHPVVTFILVGFFAAIASQIGDLFESAIKRECDVKDMGNLLPGHGGVLDRFDSMLYCSVVILLAFGVIII